MREESGIDVPAVLGGDRAEIRRWIEAVAPRLRLWAGARMSAELRRLHDADDALQEILAVVYRDLPTARLSSAAELRAWTFAVAENRIRDMARAASRLKRTGEPPEPGRVRTPSSIVSRREELDRLAAALDALAADHRDVIRLRNLEGLSVKETAERMQRSELAVRSLHHRATAELKTRLGRS